MVAIAGDPSYSVLRPVLAARGASMSLCDPEQHEPLQGLSDAQVPPPSPPILTPRPTIARLHSSTG